MASAESIRNREFAVSMLSRHLRHVYHFVRHRLAELRALGDILPDDLTAEEVVDAVVLRAYRELAREQPSARDLRRRLMAWAREQLDGEVKRLKEWRRRTPVHIEDDVPETPPAEAVSRLGEEILEFYEPEEDLKVEDVLPDLSVANPEQEAERRELEWCMGAALAGLPEQWRRALELHLVEGRPRAEAAQALGTSEEEAQHMLDRARDYVRQRLRESGCAVDS
jgi:RNA polymerase sigma factor (sigma-70 family)